jgi:anti-anti-sigma regulatory factor
VSEPDPSKTCVRLRGQLTAGGLGEAQAALVESFARPGDACCDIGAIDACDTAGLQLLLSAAATARVQSRRLRIHGASSAVFDAVSRIGLDVSAIGWSEGSHD